MNLVRSSKVSKSSPIWLTVYSDLMTNLMLFFLMLFIIEKMPDESKTKIYEGYLKGNVASKSVGKSIEKIRQAMVADSIVEIKLKDAEVTQESKGVVRITLKSPVLFGSGDINLTKEAKDVLKEIGNVLKVTKGKIIVEGHTDDTLISGGKYIDNLDLSVKRAISVVNYFVENEKFPENRFIAAGYGEFKPLDKSKDQIARSKNRRIEILIMEE